MITEEVLERQTNLLINIILTTANDYFGLTKAAKKKNKGWWSKDIKLARREVKKATQRFKIRQTISNHTLLK